MGVDRPTTRRIRHGVSATMAAVMVAGVSLVGPSAQATETAYGRNGVVGFLHVFVVVMENRSEQSVMANPTMARLATRGGLATNDNAVAHPSLPNYLALAAGSTFGITSDCVTCYVSAPNLFSQLAGAHVSFDAYMEGAPSPCFLATYGGNDYASKHNPFRYFNDVRSSRSLCSHLRPFGDLAATLRRPAAAVPSFIWVTPTLCHDGHDCSTGVAATWLTGFVNQVTASAAFKSGGLLIITWDEGFGSLGGGGQVATFVISQQTKPGTRVATPLNHYSLLATVEDNFGLARLGHAAGARNFSSFFTVKSVTTG
jgi:hypothetical protein